jgi:hypothetical protein
MALRVFVSSTFRDLAAHRERLRLALRKSIFEVSGMEDFPAQDAPPLDVALEALGNCDVYVGIIGTRYGASPPGQDKSYTELEYDRASEQGLYRIILVSEAEPQPGEEDPERMAAQVAFRTRLMETHMVDRFSNPDDLAWRVLAALTLRDAQVREEAQPNNG